MRYTLLLITTLAILFSVACKKSHQSAPTPAPWSSQGTSTPINGVLQAFALDNNGIPYVAYTDSALACITGQATLKKYVNGSWITVGSPNFTYTDINKMCLVFDPNNALYVAVGYLGGLSATVLKLNDSSWQTIGNISFGVSTQWYLFSFLSDATGAFYLAYYNTILREVYVDKYNGSSWTFLGQNADSSAFSFQGGGGPIGSIDMKLDGNGDPVVMYSIDNGQEGYDSVTVMKYNSNTWSKLCSVEVGNSYCSYAMDALGAPYILCNDSEYTPNGKLSVIKYVDSNWVNVGNAEFSHDTAFNNCMTIDRSGTPYVVFCGTSLQGDLFGPVSAMKYDGSNWTYFGSSNNVCKKAGNPLIAIDNNGTPYIAYQDYSYLPLYLTIPYYLDSLVVKKF